jgi:hypothetical protein
MLCRSIYDIDIYIDYQTDRVHILSSFTVLSFSAEFSADFLSTPASLRIRNPLEIVPSIIPSQSPFVFNLWFMAR